MHQTSGEKIPHAQVKQQRDHNQHVLLENQIREGKKGGIFSFKWIGSYTTHVISERNLHSLINNAGKQQDSEEKQIVYDENHPIS